MSSLDSLITSDLAALGDDSRRGLVGLEDTLRTKNMYRDDRAGAEARRDALAGERRVELAMMPLSLAHVFAHRVGRIAVGAAALLASFAVMAVLTDPALLRLASWMFDAYSHAVKLDHVLLLVMLALCAVYIVSVWIGEAWFARRMRETIRTSDEPYRDIDELAQGPLEIAQCAVKRLDALVIGFSLAGGAALVLSFGYLAVMVKLPDFGYSSWYYSGLLHPAAAERNVDVLVLAVFITMGFSVWLARAVRLDRLGVPKVLGHWSTLVSVCALALAIGYISADTMTKIRHYAPSPELRYLLGVGSTAVVCGTATWLLLAWRRREQARIGE